MNIMNRLTIRHLLLNRQRTLLTVIGIMLSVAMVCAVAGFAMSFRNVMRDAITDARGDYHVAYIGVTEETAELIANEDIFETHYLADSEYEGLVDVFLRLKEPGRDYWEVATAVTEKYSVQTTIANKELLALEGVVESNDSNRAMTMIAVIVIVIIVIGSVTVIANAFYISATERVRQFGLLKSTGATSAQILRSILFEALTLGAVAIPGGLVFGFLIQFVVLKLVNVLLTEINALNDNVINFRFVFSPMVVIITVAITAFTVMVSAWLPARKAAKTNAIDAIRRSGDIKMGAKQLKTSWIVQRLFGFEGTLAAKSLKRSRGKYRATVVSLVVSIVLVISMSTLIWIMNTEATIMYTVFGFDVLVNLSDTLDSQDEVQKMVESIPNAEWVRNQYASMDANIPDDFFAGQTAKTRVSITPLPDNEFKMLAPPASGASGEILKGILLNPSGKKSIGGMHKEFDAYRYTDGMELSLLDKEQSNIGSISLVSEIKDVPDYVPWELFLQDAVNIIIPESVYKDFVRTNETRIETDSSFLVNTDDPDAYYEAIVNLIPDDYSVRVLNIMQMTRINRNISTIIKLFGYGFIAMLSLIAITSVISTISTGMALRTQEFAMLYSAGMTPEGMDKMLNLESLLYGLKSLAIGLPLGVGLSYIVYMAVKNVADFSYDLPWPSMIVCVIGVMLLTFGTMRYGRIKMSKINIIDAIRSETV